MLTEALLQSFPESQQQDRAAYSQRASASDEPTGQAARSLFVLENCWLEETLMNARRILDAQDPFLQALLFQRDGVRRQEGQAQATS